MTSTEITTSKPITKAELQEIAERIRSRYRRAVEDIIATGRDLATVKDQLDHGEFLDWINSEFQMSVRTAQRYISAAAWAEGKSDTVSHLSPSKLYLLAAPSTPETVTEEVVAGLEAGEPIDDYRIEFLISKARGEAHKKSPGHIAASKRAESMARNKAAKPEMAVEDDGEYLQLIPIKRPQRRVKTRIRLLTAAVDALVLSAECLLEVEPPPLGDIEAAELVAKLEGVREDTNKLIKRLRPSTQIKDQPEGRKS